MKFYTALIIVMIFSYSNPDYQDKPDLLDSGQEQKPLFSFGVFADAQYCDCEPSGSRYFRSSLEKLKEALTSIKKSNPDFIINLGDLIDKYFASFNPVLEVINNSGMKVYHVAGNHDFSVEEKQKKQVRPILGLKNGYYSFSHGQFRFIVLDGNEISTYGTTNNKVKKQASELIKKLEAEGKPNAMDWNGGISSWQISWLINQLDSSIKEKQKVFIICHFPVWPQNEHNLLNYREVQVVVQQYDNIIAWFSGHNHAGNYGKTGMKHFVNFKGMVETENLNSYAVVEVYRNKIWIKGYGREKSMILAY
ncbi:MAG: metallophosphoesterase [Bacteroidales bacterium]|nr:metallophosphoesterase [Bacteroidales bacterium]